jgi:hypothetical protein
MASSDPGLAGRQVYVRRRLDLTGDTVLLSLIERSDRRALFGSRTARWQAAGVEPTLAHFHAGAGALPVEETLAFSAGTSLWDRCAVGGASRTCSQFEALSTHNHRIMTRPSVHGRYQDSIHHDCM